MIAAPVVEEQIDAIVASRMDLPGPSKFRNSRSAAPLLAPCPAMGTAVN